MDWKDYTRDQSCTVMLLNQHGVMRLGMIRSVDVAAGRLSVCLSDARVLRAALNTDEPELEIGVNSSTPDKIGHVEMGRYFLEFLSKNAILEGDEKAKDGLQGAMAFLDL